MGRTKSRQLKGQKHALVYTYVADNKIDCAMYKQQIIGHASDNNELFNRTNYAR